MFPTITDSSHAVQPRHLSAGGFAVVPCIGLQDSCYKVYVDPGDSVSH